MRYTSRLAGVLLTLCALAPAAAEQVTASGLTLGDGLEAALTRAGTPDPEAHGFRASRWLAAVPSLSLSYLDSREAPGTDEAEVALNLPLKSPARRRADARLREADKLLDQARADHRRLYFSGLIREAWWSHRLAILEREGTLRRISVLESLAERQRDLAEAGQIPRYALLIARRELLNARAEAASREAEVSRWRDRYRDITGLPLPDDRPPRLADAPETPPGWTSEHPAMRLLEHDWERQQAILAAGTSAADSWNLGVIGKELRATGFDEQQVGISIEVPLSFLPVAAQAERSDWQAGARQYWQNRDELLAELEQRLSGLLTERRSLEARLEGLREMVAIDQEIAGHLGGLAEGNEIESELLLKRRLDILSTELELALAEARLKENGAMLHQAMGEAL